jgi:hypothetical protein
MSPLVKILIPVCWTLLALIGVGALALIVMTLGDRTHSPEAGPGLGVFAALLILGLFAILAVLTTIAVRKQSAVWLVIMTLVLVWPLVGAVGRPLVMAYRRGVVSREEAKNGDFPDPALEAMAKAIATNDTTTLARLLGNRPPPDGRDRAGNDLLAYALVRVRDQRGDVGPVRVLLEAGADPQSSRIANRKDVVNYLVTSTYLPTVREALTMLLERGADPNLVDPETGETPLLFVYYDEETLHALVEHGANIDFAPPAHVPPVVALIGAQKWDMALYLIEKGANLDSKNESGSSVDYWLNEWKNGIYGRQDEGWERVKAAIAKRRALFQIE